MSPRTCRARLHTYTGGSPTGLRQFLTVEQQGDWNGDTISNSIPRHRQRGYVPMAANRQMI